MKVSATWNGVTFSETDRCVIVGGVHYFPAEYVDSRYLEPNNHRTECPWKGTATYFDLIVSGTRLPHGAWQYADPKDGYEHIRGAIAFSPAVRVERVDGEHDLESHVRSGASAVQKAAATTAAKGPITDTNEEILSFLNQMPKCEVHLHLEAMIDAERLWRLVGRNPELLSRIAGREDLLRCFQVRSLDDFITLFIGVIQPAIAQADDLTLFVEAARDYMQRNRIEYAEMHLAPTKLLEKGLDFEEMVDVVDRSAAEVKRRDGLEMRFLIDVSRGFGLENAQRNLDLTIAHRRDCIVGIGFGGAESAGPASEFAIIFRQAREAGLRTTAHAGEVVGPDSIRAAVDLCGAERIGHGVSAVEDRSLIDELARRRIPVELCPSSNVFTGVYVESIGDHPMRTFFDAGIPVSLNTDDPVIFGVELTDEFMSAHQYHHFTPAELVKLNDYAIDMSFMPESAKRAMKARIQAVVGDTT